MRSTLTLDPDVAQKVKAKMAQQQATFKQVINDALRRGLTGSGKVSSRPYRVTAKPLGLRPGFDLHRLNQLADELEVQALVNQLAPHSSAPRKKART
jgi:hypothetical protein